MTQAIMRNLDPSSLRELGVANQSLNAQVKGFMEEYNKTSPIYDVNGKIYTDITPDNIINWLKHLERNGLLNMDFITGVGASAMKYTSYTRYCNSQGLDPLPGTEFFDLLMTKYGIEDPPGLSGSKKKNGILNPCWNNLDIK